MNNLRKISLSNDKEWFNIDGQDWLELNLNGEGFITIAARITCTKAVADFFMYADNPIVLIDFGQKLKFYIEKDSLDTSYKDGQLFFLGDILL